jgi:hypothetical protein
MAQQKFSNSFREALWEAYGKKCFHCTGELLFADMQVDHIIPEQLHRGAVDKRESVLKEIGLPLDCVSAWNKDPVFGVIGIQLGPRH